jgi:hypothetical protein
MARDAYKEKTKEFEIQRKILAGETVEYKGLLLKKSFVWTITKGQEGDQFQAFHPLNPLLPVVSQTAWKNFLPNVALAVKGKK